MKGKPIQFPSIVCVGYELSSRAVASQVFSPLQRLTSVFGMGTGGPTALKTLTLTVRPFDPTIQTDFLPQNLRFLPHRGISFMILLSKPDLWKPACGLVHLRGLEPRTH